jgi:maltose alpha-D-glucosyltransferase/alpha-amylase
MRLNLGIRRRLAPLLDNDPRKIGLANSLLFTLPGTPVLYYGDEIGMGDDIHLFDRNGVRMPMQWDNAPNAGFSSAPAEQLYSPVISSREYAPERINVAAQRAEPGSLLNLIKRMIGVRKSHLAFSRGDLNWVESGSPTVMAFVRKYGEESILCIHNLSGSRQVCALTEPGEHPAVDLLGHKVTSAHGAIFMDAYGYHWI